MMMLQRIVQYLPLVKTFIRNSQPITLGRWHLDDCPKKTETKAHWANEDHCGPCGYSQMQTYNNDTIKGSLRSPINKKLNTVKKA